MTESCELNFMLHLLRQTDPASLPINLNIDWVKFYNLTLRHRLWHHTHRILEGSEVVMPAIAKYCDQDTKRILVTAGETIRIAKLFTAAQIKHCFVKGTLLNVHLYKALNTRPCRDIDVWVDLNAYDTAVHALLSQGYEQKEPAYELQGFKKTYYFNHYHDLAFYHPTRHVLVELHFTLNDLATSFFSIDEVALQPIYLMGMPIMSLEDHYHLLYLMIHGAIHAWSRLRWLHDIALFIKSNRCDITRIFELAKQIQCEIIVEQTLILVHDIFQLHQVTPWIKNPNPRTLQVTHIAKQFITDDYELAHKLKNINLFIKRRIYLIKLANKGKKIKTLFSDIMKIDRVFPYMTLPSQLSFLYYAFYPLWVAQFIYKSLYTRFFKKSCVS